MDEELQNWAAEMTCQDTCDIKVSFFSFCLYNQVFNFDQRQQIS